MTCAARCLWDGQWSKVSIPPQSWARRTATGGRCCWHTTPGPAHPASSPRRPLAWRQSAARQCSAVSMSGSAPPEALSLPETRSHMVVHSTACLPGSDDAKKRMKVSRFISAQGCTRRRSCTGCCAVSIAGSPAASGTTTPRWRPRSSSWCTAALRRHSRCVGLAAACHSAKCSASTALRHIVALRARSLAAIAPLRQADLEAQAVCGCPNEPCVQCGLFG